MSHIATATLSDEMEATLMTEMLVIESPRGLFPSFNIELSKQETLKLKDFLNREV